MLSRVLTLSGCLLLASLAGRAQEGAVRYVNLSDCIQSALLSNRELQIQRINPEIARLTLQSSYGYYDPIFTGDARKENATDSGGFDPSDFSRDAIYSAESGIVNAGFVGMLPLGGSYSLGGNYANSFGDRNALNFDSHKVSASASIRQPLLRNFWIDQGRMVIRINKRNLKISELGVSFLTMDVINRLQIAYYEWLYARENLGVQQRLVVNRQDLVRGTDRQIEEGMLAEPEGFLARSQFAAAETALVTASNLVALAENNLRTLMGDPFTNLVEMVPTDALVIAPQALNLASLRMRAIESRPDVAQLREDIERANIDLKYRRNQLFPSLDVIAGYGRKGASTMQVAPPTEATARSSEAFEQLWDGTAPSDYVGVIFSIPIGRISERANYKVSKQLKEQATLRLRQLEELALRQVSDAWSTLQTSYESMAAARRSREYAESALQAEERKLLGGRSTLFFVLQLQSDLTRAQAAEVRVKGNYNQALSQLYFVSGTLLEEKGVSVEIE